MRGVVCCMQLYFEEGIRCLIPADVHVGFVEEIGLVLQHLHVHVMWCF